MSNKWMKKLQSLEGAVVGDFNPHEYVVRSPSPSFNFMFGNAHGLPQGFTAVFFGPPKSGKSLMARAMIGQMHLDDPDAMAVYFNTELREKGQNTRKMKQIWSIDEGRYQAYDVNSPELIFDRIEKEIAAMCQEGAPIKLIVIDSVNAVQGRRSMNAKGVMVQQIGDDALTIQTGLKRILPTQRKYGISVILVTQVRAEMDQHEIMRGNTTKMAAAFALQHYAEYFIYIAPNKTKDGRTDLLGKKFEDEDLKDVDGKADRTGHKIWAQMRDSSMGPKLRTSEFTLDYKKGLINVHEEVFLLGINRGIIHRPNQTTYEFGGRRWVGKPAMLDALEKETELQEAIVKELRVMDLKGIVPEAVVSEESPVQMEG